MKNKRNLLTGMSAIAVALMVTATAFACTVFKGTMTLTGNASTASVVSTGSGTGMTDTLTAGIAKAHKTNGTITVQTGRDSFGRGLPAKSYLLRYYNSTAGAPGYSDHYHWQTDCMAGSSGVTLATVSIGSDGRIVGGPITKPIVSANLDTAPQESTVCVSDSGGFFGNQTPLTIVL